MFTVSNGLSLTRIPLAFLFLAESVYLRLIAIVLAMITDVVDGYLARKNKSVSRLGTILDPCTDKFFVFFALSTLFLEGKILAWQGIAMLSRDLAVYAYGAWIFFMGKWKSLVVRAIQAGKIATTLQFIVLLGLVFNVSFSSTVYCVFILTGFFALIELFYRDSSPSHRWNIFAA